jgi:hypothetical protein
MGMLSPYRIGAPMNVTESRGLRAATRTVAAA